MRDNKTFLDSESLVVRDNSGKVRGVWIPGKVTPNDHALLRMSVTLLESKNVITQEEGLSFYIDLGDRDGFRVVDHLLNGHDGAFLIFGNAEYPGENRPTLERVRWRDEEHLFYKTRGRMATGGLFITFNCPCCGLPCFVDRNSFHPITGVRGACSACGEISWIPSTYVRVFKWLFPPIIGGALVSRDDLSRWIETHPYITAIVRRYPNRFLDLLNYFGVWVHCSSCGSDLTTWNLIAGNKSAACSSCPQTVDFVCIAAPMTRRIRRFIES